MVQQAGCCNLKCDGREPGIYVACVGRWISFIYSFAKARN